VLTIYSTYRTPIIRDLYVFTHAQFGWWLHSMKNGTNQYSTARYVELVSQARFSLRRRESGQIPIRLLYSAAAHLMKLV